MKPSWIRYFYIMHFGTNCPKVWQAPPVWAAFFMSGASPEKGRLYAVFRFCYQHFADPRCCPRRWPWRVGRGEFAGRLRFRQPRCQCSWLIKKHNKTGQGQPAPPLFRTANAAIKIWSSNKKCYCYKFLYSFVSVL